MVAPLIAYGAWALGGTALGYLASRGGSQSQDTPTEQSSKNETKQSAETRSEVQPVTKTTSTTNNTQRFNYDFSNSVLNRSNLGLGEQSQTPKVDTSPKVEASVTPSTSQGSTTTPQLSNTPSIVQQQPASSESLFSNPLVLAGLGVGAYFLLSDDKKGGKA